MKVKSGILAIMFIGSVAFAQAQGGGGGMRRTVEERVSMVHAKFDSTYKFDAAKEAKVDTAFASYYRQQDKLRAEMSSGGERPDMQAMRDKMQPIMEARDKELKGILSDTEYKKWKDELEPALRPQRQGGGGNRQQ